MPMPTPARARPGTHAPGVIRRSGPMLLALAASLALVAMADAATPSAAAAQGRCAPGSGVPVEALPDVVAHYDVRIVDAAGAVVGEQAWRFERRAGLVALRKGEVEEQWHRDARGAVSLVRVFHPDQRAVDYSSGELRTIGLDVDWSALARLADTVGLVPAGGGEAAVCDGRHVAARFEGERAGEQLQLAWSADWQIPGSLQRQGRQRTMTIALRSAEAPAGVAPGVPASYLRLDSSDFGDMAYDPFVRRAEARDVRAGWRTAHEHE